MSVSMHEFRYSDVKFMCQKFQSLNVLCPWDAYDSEAYGSKF